MEALISSKGIFLIYYCAGSDQKYMRYRFRFQRMIIAGIFIFACSWQAVGASGKPALRLGKVVAASVNGHGSSTENKRARLSGQDIWWTYVISSEDRIYSVVSRENPARTGLATNSAFQFYEQKNWIYIPRPKGKPTALKILNKSK
jgi:hypothetical protein